MSRGTREGSDCEPETALPRVTPSFQVGSIERHKRELRRDEESCSDCEKNTDSDENPFGHATPWAKTLDGVI